MATTETIDNYIAGLDDWQSEALSALRKTINDADSRLSEDWKWGCPVWVYKGNVCSVGAFKTHVKVNFFKGARLEDPNGLFNAGLDAKESRSIDLSKDETIDNVALAEVIREATALNE